MVDITIVKHIENITGGWSIPNTSIMSIRGVSPNWMPLAVTITQGYPDYLPFRIQTWLENPLFFRWRLEWDGINDGFYIAILDYQIENQI